MNSMSFSDLETAYELLAKAVDRAGEDRERLFLARLALTLAHATGDIDIFEAAVATALDGLDSIATDKGNAPVGGADPA
jgi:hypothetical protein